MIAAVESFAWMSSILQRRHLPQISFTAWLFNLRAFQYLFITMTVALLSLTSAASDPIVISPDGAYLVFGSNDGKIEIRDARNGDLLHRLRHQGTPSFDPTQVRSSVNWTPHFAFSDDSQVFASSCGYAPVLLFETETGKIIRELDGVSVGYNLTFSPDGSRLLGTGIDGLAGPRRLSLWDSHSGQKLKDLTAETGFGTSQSIHQNFRTARFSAAGSMLLIEYLEGETLCLRVWDARTGKETILFKTSANESLHSSLSPDGERLTIRRQSNRIEISLWNTASGEIIQEWKQDGTP